MKQLNVDVLNFGLGQEPQAHWRHNCASLEEAHSLFRQAALGCAYECLHLRVEGTLICVAYRLHDGSVEFV